MGYQTEVKIGGPLRLPAAAAVISAGATAAGRGAKWDASNAVIALSGGDDRVDFIINEIHSDDTEVSVIPFETGSQFRARLAAVPGTLALGKLIKVDDSGAGLFALGGAASDVNVAICEEVSTASGAALIRPISAGTVTT